MPPPLHRRSEDGGTESRPRRRIGASRPSGWLLVLLAVVGGFLVWASQQDGGVSGTFERFSDWVDGRLDDLTDSAETDAAIDYYNTRYANEGIYPRITDGVAREDGLDLTGLRVTNCSSQHIVIESFSGRGTGSYLLVAGESWGRVQGRQDCPENLSNPLPWTSPEAETSN